MAKKKSKMSRNFNILGCLVVIGGFIPYMIAGSRSSDEGNRRIAAYEAQHPARHINLSAYLGAMGIDITQPLPIDVGRPIAGATGSVEGSGLFVLGSGHAAVHGDINAQLYIPVTVQVGGVKKAFIVPAARVVIKPDLAQARIIISDREVQRVQDTMFCHPELWRPDKFDCSATSGPDLSEYLLRQYRDMPIGELLISLANSIEVPASAIT